MSGNVVLRLIGDEWEFNEKIAISIPGQKPFNSQNVRFSDKLGLESFGPPWTLYHTEGRHPHHIRPTRPIDHKSNPSKEKLRTASVLYVKEADLATQERDVQFQESLEAFRKAQGKKPNEIAPDGADVEEFVESYSKNLNVRDATDLWEHYMQIRDKLEGECYRLWWAMTFELREVADFKAKEAAARDELYESTLEAIRQAYFDTIIRPQTIAKIKKLESAEATARKKELLEAEDDEWEDEIKKQHRRKVQAIEDEERMRRQQQEMLLLQQQQQQAAAAAAAAANAASSGGGGGGGGGMSKEDMEELMKTLKDTVKESRKEMMASMEDAVSTMVDKVQRETTAHKDMVTKMLAQQNDATERITAAAGSVNQKNIRDRHGQLQEQLDSLLPAAHAIPEDEQTAQKMAELVEEQNAILKEMISLEDERLADEQRVIDATNAQQESALVTSLQVVQSLLLKRVETIAERQEELSVAVEHQQQQLQEGSAAANDDTVRERHPDDHSKSRGSLGDVDKGPEDTIKLTTEHDFDDSALLGCVVQSPSATTVYDRLSAATMFPTFMDRTRELNQDTGGLHPAVFEVFVKTLRKYTRIPKELLMKSSKYRHATQSSTNDHNQSKNAATVATPTKKKKKRATFADDDEVLRDNKEPLHDDDEDEDARRKHDKKKRKHKKHKHRSQPDAAEDDNGEDDFPTPPILLAMKTEPTSIITTSAVPPIPSDVLDAQLEASIQAVLIDRLSSLVVQFGGDVLSMSDDLVFQYGIHASPHRQRVYELCELHAPYMCNVVDLLLDFYAGREAEVAAKIVAVAGSGASSSVDEATSSPSPRGVADQFSHHADPESGATYYYHAGLNMTQWLRPVGY